jgi:hypothetical protein
MSTSRSEINLKGTVNITPVHFGMGSLLTTSHSPLAQRPVYTLIMSTGSPSITVTSNPQELYSLSCETLNHRLLRYQSQVSSCSLAGEVHLLSYHFQFMTISWI